MLNRGIWQGLNLLFFNICLEPLTETIRKDKHIEGVKDDRGREYKISFFADDIILLSSDPVCLILLSWSNTVSEYKTNNSKSEAMMLSGT